MFSVGTKEKESLKIFEKELLASNIITDKKTKPAQYYKRIASKLAEGPIFVEISINACGVIVNMDCIKEVD